MKELHFKVIVKWDQNVNVWYVSDTDVPGLSAEAKNLDEMSKELSTLIPELLVLNGVIGESYEDDYEVPWQLVSEHQDKIRAAC